MKQLQFVKRNFSDGNILNNICYLMSLNGKVGLYFSE